MYYVILGDGKTRDALMAHLKENEIGAVFHYVPLHTSAMGKRFGYREGDLPLTENLSTRLLRLPFYADITRDEQTRVVGCLAEFLERPHAGSGGRQRQ
jgi:dTDP-4-amino-4,6-dideoxygalactose transaminase